MSNLLQGDGVKRPYITVTPSTSGFEITAGAEITHAFNATEVALAIIHVYGGGAQQLDNRAACPFCRDRIQFEHGYNWRAEASAP